MKKYRNLLYSPKLETYLDLCTQVYELSKPQAPEDAYAFYRHYVSRSKGPILEPMCGSGRFLLPLFAEGFDIHGFDASEPMLNALHTKTLSQNLKPHVWHGFIENLTTAQQYDLIFIPAGSFGLITDLQTAQDALQTFYEHLNTGGILLFEAETLTSIPDPLGLWKGSVWPRSDSKIIVCHFLDLPLQDQVTSTLCKYELVENHHVVHTEVETLKVRLYEPTALVEMLKQAGFEHIRLLKTFDTEQTANPRDPQIVYECTK